MTDAFHPSAGAHTHPEGARRVAEVDPTAEIEISLVLRPQQARLTRHVDRMLGMRSQDVRHLNYAEVESSFGFGNSDVDAVDEFARTNNLTVGEADPISGTVKIRGRAEDLNAALKINLGEYEMDTPSGPVRYRTYDGIVQLPSAVAARVEGVAGLSTRPFVQPRIFPMGPAPAPAQPRQGFGAAQIGQAYGIPAGARASKQKIGIIELGGGYTVKDIQEYCRISGVPMPRLRDVSVDGATNSPARGVGDPGTADGEVSLDIQVLASVAQGAELDIYFAPNTDAGFVDAVAQAVRDGCTSISISWGAPESQWPPAAMRAFDRACQTAQAMGISVFCAAGDNGSSDGIRDGRSHADFPATSPHVVACGGTKLPNLDRSKETTWNDQPMGGATGGGVSDVWPVPSFQQGMTLPPSANDGRTRRTIPDLSADAAPSTGWRVYINGQWYAFGGTSAVSPLFAGMAALMAEEIQKRKPSQKLGDWNTLLYNVWAKNGAVQSIDDGTGNGAYKTGPGYNAALGWGTPKYAEMLQLTLQAAGIKTPRKPSPRPIQRPTSNGPDQGLAA